MIIFKNFISGNKDPGS